MSAPEMSQPGKLLFLSMGMIDAKTFFNGCLRVMQAMAEDKTPIPAEWVNLMKNEKHELEKMVANMGKLIDEMPVKEETQ